MQGAHLRDTRADGRRCFRFHLARSMVGARAGEVLAGLGLDGWHCDSLGGDSMAAK